MRARKLFLVTALLATVAAVGWAQSWGFSTVANISATMGVNDGRVCVGEGSRQDLGCPTYAPSVNSSGLFTATTIATGGLTVTGATSLSTVSATIGDFNTLRVNGIAVTGGAVTATTAVGFVANSSQNATTSLLRVGSYSASRNDGSGLNTSTGVFTAPYTGYYQFNAHTQVVNTNSNAFSLVIQANGTNVCYNYNIPSYSGNYYTPCSASVYLTAGQTAELQILASGGTTGATTYFQGYLVTGLMNQSSGTTALDDRITSGTTTLVAISNTSFVSLTQGGTNTAWFDPTRGLVTLGVSTTGGISGTTGYFAGNVGIGTNTPAALLDISGSVNGAVQARVSNINSGASAWSGLALINDSNTVGLLWAPSSNYSVAHLRNRLNLYSSSGITTGGGIDIMASWTNQDIRFYTGGTSTSNERMRMTSNGNIGIGSVSPNASLTVVGEVQVSNSGMACSGTTAGAIRYSSNVVSYCNGSVWTTLGGSGTASPTNVPAFFVHRSGANQTVGSGVLTALDWTTEVFDATNAFDTSTDRFTPNVAGRYLLSGSVWCTNSTSYCQIAISKNGVTMAAPFSPGSATVGQGTAIIDLNGTTDYVEMQAINGGGTTLGGTATYTYFTGSLLASGNGVVSGSTTPGGVSGSIQFNGNGTFAGRSDLVVDSTGRVGIGTSSPLISLTVVGEVQVSNSGVLCGGTTAGAIRYSGGALSFCNGSAWTTLGSAGAADWYGLTNIPTQVQNVSNGTTLSMSLVSASNISGSLAQITRVSSTNISATNISTTRLTVNGVDITGGGNADRITSSTTAAAIANQNGGTVSFTLGGTSGAAYLHPTLGLVAPGVSTTGGISGTTGYFQTSVRVSNGLVLYDVSNSSDITFSGNGYVSSEQNLWFNIDANNDSTGSAFRIGKDRYANTSGTTLLSLLENGNLGLGIITPVVSLTVVGEVQVSNSGVTCSGPTGGAIRYSGGTLSYCNGTAWTGLTTGSSTPGGVSGSIQFNGNGTFAGRSNLVVDANGQVGIGTGTPNASLTVIGRVSATTVQVGRDSVACGSGDIGALRLDPATGRLQVCRQ